MMMMMLIEENLLVMDNLSQCWKCRGCLYDCSSTFHSCGCCCRDAWQRGGWKILPTIHDHQLRKMVVPSQGVGMVVVEALIGTMEWCTGVTGWCGYHNPSQDIPSVIQVYPS